MNVSYTWIQEYFDDALPEPQELVERITKGAWEVEQVEKKGDDHLIDVDVLPNRAHDCLCHRGVAKEIGVLIGKPVRDKTYERIQENEKLKDEISIKVDDTELCPRYIGRYVQNIKVGPSPKWLKDKIELIGQRSINNLVDVTNYVLFELGQPLHVFDADKLDNNEIKIRKAERGETISTLDEKNVELDDTMLIIADGSSPIALAGIKGGKKAEVDENTTNIVIEAANFDPVSVRKTSQKTQIKTDASKRYENGITSEMAAWGMDMVTRLILEVAGKEETQTAPVIDHYSKKEEMRTIIVSLEKIKSVLGTSISENEVENIFDLFGFDYIEKDDAYSIKVPFERLDLCIAEDVAEEVGRVYGYDKIQEQLPGDMGFKPTVNKTFYYHNKIRALLVQYGYSELQTYVLRDRGEIELANPLAKDKPFLRESIYDGLFDAITLNARYVDLLGVDTVNVFEIGTVFRKDREHVVFGIGYHDPHKKKSKAKEKEILELVLQRLSDDLGEKVTGRIEERENAGAVVQVDLSKLIERLPQPRSYGDVLETHPPQVRFKPISQYPFVTRDIAVFVANEEEQVELERILEDKGGELLAREPRLFDVFKKENEDGSYKISYAYKLVFQSHERTLTDQEVNEIMDSIYDEIHSHKEWEVR